MDDLAQMYANSLLIHKNKPLLVERFYTKTEVNAFDLTTQRNVVLKEVNHEDFKAPGRVFGFVNIDGYVVYVSRTSIRRYKVGLSNENMALDCPKAHERVMGGHKVAGIITSPEICDAIFNRYPTISEAWNRVKDRVDNIVAFDRQFAVDYRGDIYYKTTKVGTVLKNPKTNNDIRWFDNYTHLNILLDNNYEKSIRTAA